jgi:hypothetical protein
MKSEHSRCCVCSIFSSSFCCCWVFSRRRDDSMTMIDDMRTQQQAAVFSLKHIVCFWENKRFCLIKKTSPFLNEEEKRVCLCVWVYVNIHTLHFYTSFFFLFLNWVVEWCGWWWWWDPDDMRWRDDVTMNNNKWIMMMRTKKGEVKIRESPWPAQWWWWWW